MNGPLRSPGRRRYNFKRRSDAILYGSPYQKAAALVDLANDGGGIPEIILDLPNIQKVAKYYFMFVRFDIIWTLNYIALLTLNFFEKPLWCNKVSKVSCSNKDYYYLGDLPYLTDAGSLAFEGVTLVLLVVHTAFPVLYEGGSIYWSHRVNKLKVILLLIFTADLVVYILYLSPVAIHTLPFRIAPYLRVVFFIIYFRGLRDCLVILAGMVGAFYNVLVLCLMFLLFYSWLAYVIFEDSKQGTTVFVSYPSTLYQMFVLFTTSNNPDVWIPAYESSRWSSLFFVLFVLLGVYFVTNLVLGFIYETFESELAKQVGAKDEMKNRILGRAFQLIDEHRCGSLDKGQCIHLFEELKYYRMLPNISVEEFDTIFHELDDNDNFKIELVEFSELINVLAIKFQKDDTEPYLKRFAFYVSPISERVKGFLKSPKFGYVTVFVLLLNLAAVIAETTVDIQNISGHKSWQKVEFVFAWIYLFEVVLHVYTYGFENYWDNSENRYNFILTWIIVTGETLTLVSPKELAFISSEGWIIYLLLARMIRSIRLLMQVQKYLHFFKTLLSFIPSFMPYLGTIFCVMCIYCTLGIQVFGGLVNAGNSDLPSTDLADNNYLLFNLNDYPNGMVTLFNLLVMGSWQVWMKDYVTLTGTSWTYMYFISFYLITVLLLLNLIVAFVLQAFFAQMDLKSFEEKQERRARLRPRVGTKTSSQKVDMLLHHMLGGRLHRSPSASL